MLSPSQRKDTPNSSWKGMEGSLEKERLREVEVRKDLLVGRIQVTLPASLKDKARPSNKQTLKVSLSFDFGSAQLCDSASQPSFLSVGRTSRDHPPALAATQALPKVFVWGFSLRKLQGLTQDCLSVSLLGGLAAQPSGGFPKQVGPHEWPRGCA